MRFFSIICRRRARLHTMKFLSILLMAATTLSVAADGPHISEEQAREIGRKIWRNECAGTVAGLTSWNRGEEFPSLGIAHFIWYPAEHRGPFEESFPGLARFLKSQGKPVADWMLGPCPWISRSEFQADINGPRLTSLRLLLAATVSEQARYAALRLESALPKMLHAAPPADRARIQENFNRVASEHLGYYALMDYVNFKGEGVNPSERYNGQGWGLLQVLESMRPNGQALNSFAAAADLVLARRVKNAPASRNEAQWLPGWNNRIKTYTL